MNYNLEKVIKHLKFYFEDHSIPVPEILKVEKLVRFKHGWYFISKNGTFRLLFNNDKDVINYTPPKVVQSYQTQVDNFKLIIEKERFEKKLGEEPDNKSIKMKLNRIAEEILRAYPNSKEKALFMDGAFRLLKKLKKMKNKIVRSNNQSFMNTDNDQIDSGGFVERS